MFLAPPSVYEEQVVDMNDVYAACEKNHGKPIDLAVKSTYNPKTRKYFAFSDSFVPDPVNYRSDLWGDIGMKPDTWDNVRIGGKRIKDKTGIPVGIGLSAELDTAMAMRAIMYSFGAHEQDVEGNLAINSKELFKPQPHAAPQGVALLCKQRYASEAMSMSQIRTIGSLRARTTPRRRSAPRWGIC
jgi:multiple sugar transport system substrate-binding protein